mmetsp:Transcript_3062/g.6563  ORF Transcript_3062/g.6563 Transcript_3062/m.6563 type:complete len:211 (-) Transcript_3062:303-935(-)
MHPEINSSGIAIRPLQKRIAHPILKSITTEASQMMFAPRREGNHGRHDVRVDESRSELPNGTEFVSIASLLSIPTTADGNEGEIFFQPFGNLLPIARYSHAIARNFGIVPRRNDNGEISSSLGCFPKSMSVVSAENGNQGLFDCPGVMGQVDVPELGTADVEVEFVSVGGIAEEEGLGLEAGEGVYGLGGGIGSWKHNTVSFGRRIVVGA